jgi:murein DD-endopeptidase MepM/ murein hydrolase activator NlpD
MKRAFAAVLLAASQLAIAAQRPPLADSFDLQVTWSPASVTIAGTAQFVYELHVSSFAAAPLELERIDVIDESDHRHVASLAGDDLKQAIGRPDLPAKGSDPARIPPGVRAVVYLSIPAAGLAGHRLEHMLAYRSLSGESHDVRGGEFTAASAKPIVLGPPLRGGPWAAIYNAAWARGHRRVLYTVNGKVHIPGRFAIDWIKLDNAGKHARGGGSRPADWYGYGEQVLAVADATVADAQDDMGEPTRVSDSNRVAMEKASGNYVALDLGQGRYVFYEHLKPGSIRVKAGDKVKRGQVIGLLGYTGNTTGPHLHLHVSNGNTPLDAEGLPYAFDRYEWLGTFASPQAFEDGQAWLVPAGGSKQSADELPAPFSVVAFPTD